MSSENFSLKWIDFQSNLTSSIQDLRSDHEFADVTLVSMDNQRIEAHKVILSSASMFFKSVLSGMKHSHPMIYMKGVSAKKLEPIVHFIYHGEVNVYQADLDDFLQLAEELGLKGLNGSTKETETIEHLEKNIHKPVANQRKMVSVNDLTLTNTITDNETVVAEVKTEYQESKPDNLPISSGKEHAELDEIINSMLAKVDGVWVCTKCDKTSKHKTHMKSHIEIHIEGMSHPCGFCGKTLRSRTCLQAHITRKHPNN